MVNAVKELWPFGVFVVSGLLAFLVGKERQRWRVDAIGTELEHQGKRIARLEVKGAEEAVMLGEIKTAQGLILSQLTELRAELRGKVDK